jgi:Holliday junction resolvasome RuvABC DNA-binding subunit
MWRGSRWGMRLALAILSVNILGDLFNALMRHDLRTLIGLPIGGAMIAYLICSRKKPAISN